MVDFRTDIRVGIDWDDDGLVCYEALVIDDLNLIPTPTTWTSIARAAVDTSTLTVVKGRTLYGLQHTNVVTSTGLSAGMSFGKDGGSIDEIAVSAETDYALVFWVKGNTGHAGVDFEVEVRDQGDAVIGTSGTHVLTTSYQRIEFLFTTGVGDTFVYFIHRKDSSATDVDYDITGWMMTQDSAAGPAGFNAGDATNGHDNVSADIRNAKWDMGIPDRDLLIAAEGAATVNLDNLDQKYSPEKTTSPLFGFLLSRRMLTIEVADSTVGTFTLMWTGWTSKFSPATGRNRSEKCTLKCEQGIFLLKEAQFKSAIQKDVDSGAATQQIIDDSAWVSANDPTGFLGNKYGIIETGRDTYPIVGDDWNSDDSMYDALAEIIDTEQGILWLTETGQLEFRNRWYVLLKQGGSADFSLNAGTDFHDAGYEYGQQIFNEAKFTFYPKTEEADFTAWENRQAILIDAGETVVINASFEYEESTSINMSALDGTHLIVDFDTAANYVASTTLVTVLTNDEAELTITNDGSETRPYRIILKGTAVRSFGGQIIEERDQESVDKFRLQRLTKTFKLLNTQPEAVGLAQFFIARYKEPFGEFKTLALHDRDAAYYARMLNLSIGTTVDLTDTRTGTNAVRHLIMGRDGTWVQGDFTMAYTAIHIGRFNAFLLDNSKLDSDDRLGY